MTFAPSLEKIGGGTLASGPRLSERSDNCVVDGVGRPPSLLRAAAGAALAVALVTAAARAAGDWRTLPPLPYGLAAGGAACVAGRLYLVGGVAGAPDRSVLVRRMLVLNPAHPDRWRFAPGPTPREHLAVTVAAGRIYTLGGRTA